MDELDDSEVYEDCPGLEDDLEPAVDDPVRAGAPRWRLEPEAQARQPALGRRVLPAALVVAAAVFALVLLGCTHRRHSMNGRSNQAGVGFSAPSPETRRRAKARPMRVAPSSASAAGAGSRAREASAVARAHWGMPSEGEPEAHLAGAPELGPAESGAAQGNAQIEFGFEQ